MRNALPAVVRYCRIMPKRIDFDWHLTEWMAATGSSQADLCRATGFPKAKLSELVNGKSRYNRDVVNALADALNIRPFELLLPPSDANAIRKMRESVLTLAAAIPDERDGTTG